jgi:hypothetical protein
MMLKALSSARLSALCLPAPMLHPVVSVQPYASARYAALASDPACQVG